MKTREILLPETTLALTLFAVLILGFQLPAQEKTWTGAVDGSWVTADNWSPSGLVTDVDSVLYDSSSTANLTQTLDQNWSVTNLNVTSATGTIIITPGSGSFVLTNTGGIDMSSATADLTILADYHPINNGTLNVAAGRTLTLSNILAAINNATTGATAGAGTVRIIGTGGRLSDNFGAGTLIIDGGHLAGNPPVRLGASPGSTVTVIVTNNGSLDISSGNSTRIRLGQVASDGTSTNRLILDGGSITIIGSTTSGANGIFVGDEAGTVGILDINNGTIDMSSDQGQDSILRIGNVAGSIGTVNFNANGVLRTRGIDRISGYAIFNWDGGFLETLANDPDYFKAVDQVNLLSGGALVDTGPRTIGFMGPLSGVGGLTKLGTGTLDLTGANTYVGPTVVSNGSFSAILPMSSGSLFLETNVSMGLTVGSSPGDTWSLSTMTLQTSNTLTFTYGAVSQPSSTLVTTTTLNASGTNMVNIAGAG